MHFEQEKDPTSFTFCKYYSGCSVATVLCGGERTNTGSCQRNSGKEFSNGEISLFNTDVLFKKKKKE